MSINFKSITTLFENNVKIRAIDVDGYIESETYKASQNGYEFTLFLVPIEGTVIFHLHHKSLEQPLYYFHLDDVCDFIDIKKKTLIIVDNYVGQIYKIHFDRNFLLQTEYE